MTKVIRCGYSVGGGAARDQGFEKDYGKGGRSKRSCFEDGGEIENQSYADGGRMHGVEVGNRRAESYTREFNEGGIADKECRGGNVKRIKRDMGGPMAGGAPMQGFRGQPQAGGPQMQRPPAGQPGPGQSQQPQRSAPSSIPVNMSYGLKKGGKANAKAAVKAILAAKEAKSAKPSTALIESITVIPKREKCRTVVCKEEGGELKKAIGGTAKIRQGTFGLRGNPLIKLKRKI